MADIKSGDPGFYYDLRLDDVELATITALASAATLLLYDSSPFVNRSSILRRFADEEGMTHFGVSARLRTHWQKLNVAPIKTARKFAHDALYRIRAGMEGFDYIF
jgi:acetoacetyl-CoA synthetase